MRWLIVLLLVANSGCRDDTPAASHPAMPNQFAVGSTINGRYRVLKKLGDAGAYAVFSVEHVALEDEPFVMIAPRTPDPESSRALYAAASREMVETRALDITEVDRTPDARVYAIAVRGDAQLRDVLAGAKRLGERRSR